MSIQLRAMTKSGESIVIFHRDLGEQGLVVRDQLICDKWPAPIYVELDKSLIRDIGPDRAAQLRMAEVWAHLDEAGVDTSTIKLPGDV